MSGTPNPATRCWPSRAVDQRGFTQPLTDDWNAKGYLMNEVQRVPVTVS